MKNRVFQLLLGISIITFSSCFCNSQFFDCVEGNGSIVTDEFDVNDFSGIILKVDANIKLTQGDRQSVEVEGQENIVDIIKLKVRNHNLIIDFDECVNHDELTIYITIPDIDLLTIHGSGNIRGENVFDVKDLELEITGSGDMDLGLEANDIDARITGSGNMKLDGSMDVFDIRISGSGDIRAFDLLSNDAKVSISGSGDVELFAKDNLDVKITGSGDVFFKGHPTLKTSITGSGEVIDAN